MADVTVPEPFPISLVGDKYLLFDVNTITHARREYHICGVLSGTLPQAQQQNVFLGIPLQLMPEEARLLVEQGRAYIVDDVVAHLSDLRKLGADDRTAFLKALHKEGMEAAKAAQQKSLDKQDKALRALGRSAPVPALQATDAVGEADKDDGLFPISRSPSVPTVSTQALKERHFITLTTSHPPLPARPIDQKLPLPVVPRSYPLFSHLHSKGYYISPGLRFGCQYLAYPGDPLRFHSHFLAVGADWDEEFDLLDLVGGGRLGTGVKKGYLLGGSVLDKGKNEGKKTKDGEDAVRTFCLEWAGM